MSNINFTNAVFYAAKGMRDRLGAFCDRDLMLKAMELLSGQAEAFAYVCNLAAPGSTPDDESGVTGQELTRRALGKRLAAAFGDDHKLGIILKDGAVAEQQVLALLLAGDSHFRKCAPMVARDAGAATRQQAIVKTVTDAIGPMGGSLAPSGDGGFIMMPPMGFDESMPEPDPDPFDEP